MRNKQLFKERNEEIRRYVSSLFKKYPHWRVDYVIEKAASRFYLSPRTVEAIMKGEGNYA